MASGGIRRLFEEFARLKVLVVGDIMLDTYLRGHADRISPEAPVPVVRIRERESRPGGAGNVALNLMSLGATPILCSVLGNDAGGEIFCHLIARKGLSEEGLIKSRHRITTIKNRVISGNQQLVRFDEEDDHDLNETDQKRLVACVFSLMEQCDLIVFEDYDKGCLNKRVISEVVTKAGELNKITAVDPKRKNFWNYGGVTLFKPNLKELNEGMKQDINPANIHDVEQGISQLRRALNHKNTLVTLSEHGVCYQSLSSGGHIAARKRQIADVSGAGDTVIGVAALALAAGLTLEEAAEAANIAGGIVCEYPGVVPIDRERLMNELETIGFSSEGF